MMGGISNFKKTFFNSSATAETSFYPALNNLVDEALKEFRFTHHLTNIVSISGQAKGLPDFGFSRKYDKLKNIIDCGVLELKSPKDNLSYKRDKVQIDKYAQNYGLVLYTNFWSYEIFSLKNGTVELLEHSKLCASKSDFPTFLKSNRQTQQVDRFFKEMILRFLSCKNPSSHPKYVAELLASYAREAFTNCKSISVKKFKPIEDAYSKTIGISSIHDLGREFFISSVIQTIFYAIFSGWYYFHIRKQKGKFDWKSSDWYVELPIIQYLFQFLSNKKNLTDLNILDPIENAGAFLERIDFSVFENHFQNSNALAFFYEPFLSNYDKKLRSALGVWFTPQKVVDYMVELVHLQIKNKFSKPLGIADPNVIILDASVGTGAYLVSAFNTIKKEFLSHGHGSLSDYKALEHAEKNLIGFDILPAPLVVAHLNLAITSDAIRTKNSPPNFRLHLTNSLDRTEPTSLPTLPFPGLSQEVSETDRIKQQEKIFVFIGNPPYEGFAANLKIRKTLKQKFTNVSQGPTPIGQGLNDPYTQFFSFGADKIVSHGQGILCLLTNYSWLDGLSHPGMREYLMSNFDEIQLDNLNGDSRKTGKKTPSGASDPSVFSLTDIPNSITLGTVIATCIKVKNDC